MSETPKRPRDDDTLEATCREVIGFLLEYLSGELPPERERAFEEHLAECPSCVAYLQTYRSTIRLARETLAPSGTPEELPRELLQAILAARP
jgi:anti-sigma factor RsiW